MKSEAGGERKGGRLERLFRVSMLLIPVGVLGNLALSWFATDHQVLATLHHLPKRYLLAAVALGLAPWVTNALRIRIWAGFIGRPMSMRDAFRITIGSELASSVLPTSTGSEVLRWGMMVQKGITTGQAASIMTLGYVEDAVFFLVAIPTAVVVARAWELPVLRDVAGRIRGNALVVAVALIAALLILRLLLRLALRGRFGLRLRSSSRRRVAKLRRRMRKTGRDFRGVFLMVRERGKLRFALTLGITAVQWSCRYSVVTALAYFLGAPVDPVLFFLLQWVIFTVMLFVPTPGAAGGAEAAFLLVYSALLPARILGIATAGWRFLTFYLQLSLGSLVFGSLNFAERRARSRGDAHGTPHASTREGRSGR
ncbi:MAG TPA: lysylphosphatidylglycerol synthase transmembrane domain-containing protein [Longimicrobiaceae bacterium]|jgi:uncharacterized protein (TIRG00374 family)|nr:lysylphosphatidylglycerol synthase transmembrane domain-containing protein [Longimicrobiaceae bacterium]